MATANDMPSVSAFTWGIRSESSQLIYKGASTPVCVGFKRSIKYAFSRDIAVILLRNPHVSCLPKVHCQYLSRLDIYIVPRKTFR